MKIISFLLIVLMSIFSFSDTASAAKELTALECADKIDEYVLTQMKEGQSRVFHWEYMKMVV